MAAIEKHPHRLVLGSGSTTLTLDKKAGKVSMQRKTLFWNRAPIEKTLAEIVDATVDTAVDRSSGVEVCNTILVSRAREIAHTRTSLRCRPVGR
jgi:pyrrolidone-carboxylate peptidase